MPGHSVRRPLRAAALGLILGTLAWIAKPASDTAPIASKGGDAVGHEEAVAYAFRLFEPGAGAPPVQAQPTGSLVLQGLSVSSGRVRALVAIGDGPPLWLEPGQGIGEWTFVGPTRAGAEFSSAEGVQELKPFADSAVAADRN